MKFFLIFLLSVISVQAEDFPWMYLRKYGSTVELKPLKPDFNESISLNPVSCYWLDQNLKKIRPEDVNGGKSDHYSINTADCVLTIYNIQADDNGIYHAVLNGTYFTKAMLNYHGPPYESVGEEYKYNLIAGFSTSGGKIYY